MALPNTIHVFLDVGIHRKVANASSLDITIEHRRVEDLGKGLGKGICKHYEMDIPEEHLIAVLDPVAMNDVDCKAGVDEVH